MSSLNTVAILAVIGLITGVAMGLVGIGGGVLLVPMLMRTGLTISEAVAISILLSSVPQGLPALYNYYKWGHIPWMKAIYVIFGCLIGMAIGSFLATKQYVSQKVLVQLLAVIMGISSVYLWFTHT